ncbi:hypothetical protein D3C76_1467850 [compost metagenome]
MGMKTEELELVPGDFPCSIRPVRLLIEEPIVVAQNRDYAAAMIDGSINGVLSRKAFSLLDVPILYELRVGDL